MSSNNSYFSQAPGVHSGWTPVTSGLPTCGDGRLFIGINTVGFVGVFNDIVDMGRSVWCMYETAEDSVEILTDLSMWAVLRLPYPTPSAYVYAAGIIASDMPGTVVRKLDAAFYDAVAFHCATPALPATEPGVLPEPETVIKEVMELVADLEREAADVGYGHGSQRLVNEKRAAIESKLRTLLAVPNATQAVQAEPVVKWHVKLVSAAAPQVQPADAPIAYLQEADQHLLYRFIETTEDDESFDIGKDAVKRLANLGVVESCGFGRYGVTMFGYWVHEHYWHQNPSLPLKTNADRDREHRAAMVAAQEGGNAAKEA